MVSKLVNIPIVKEILRYSPSKIISILVGIFSFKFYTEVFSTSEYGIYNLILSTTSLITVFLSGWIGYVLIRFFEKHKRDETLDDFLSTIYSILVLIIGGLVIIGIPSVIFLFNANKIYFLAFLSLPLTMITSLLPTYYQLDQDTKTYNLINIATGVGVFGVFFLIYFIFHLKLTGFFLATIIVNLGLMLIAARDFRKKQINFKINKKYLFEYLRYGIPQVGTGIGVVLLSVTSRYFIQYFNGADAVGLFSAAFKFGEMSILLPLGIFTSIFSPYIFREFEVKGKEKAYQIIFHYSVLYIFCFGPIVVMLYIFPSLPTVLLGDNFISSLHLIPVICLGNFVFGYTQLFGMIYQIDFKPAVITFSIILSVGINITLNFFLIPKLGIEGAAYCSVITYVCYLLMLILMSKIKVKNIPIGAFVAFIVTVFVYRTFANAVAQTNFSIYLEIVLAVSIWAFLGLLMIAFKQFRVSKIFG